MSSLSLLFIKVERERSGNRGGAGQKWAERERSGSSAERRAGVAEIDLSAERLICRSRFAHMLWAQLHALHGGPYGYVPLGRHLVTFVGLNVDL